ncbi:pyruvate decarboxylase [Pseudovirgaria hyperparasitica]|uniref:Pyruvate decarboxylase n=1 Tax=Pseudovirgaria hyperparasitica TaxID=470096 RepID=A0A6A6VTQ3_9PEZI|nr:pyruvate decarboxylase [Pseudovirgaria hyperparasitica]KAF2753593.1 pyruvate decarboxylase [Pseudovirgaria hyperparasitica]
MPDSPTIKLADYLFTRLHQLEVHSVFGVPGDYNLRLLDYVEPNKLHWVGNCNELNAAYAADGYARIAGLSALITTFGVGELSAINGVAGAYAERAAVVHICGTPSRKLQDERVKMHHTFADGEYRRFAEMHKHVTAAQTELRDSRTAPEQIDWIIGQAMLHSRPVYLEIPDDMVDVEVSSTRLAQKIISPEALKAPSEPQILQSILDRIYSAKRPLILIDGESRPMGVLGEVDELVKTSSWPTWTTTYGKGLVDESLPSVHGMYTGKYGLDGAKAYFESADLILVFGPHYSDTNTNGFTCIPNQTSAVLFQDMTIHVGTETYRDVSGKRILSQLLQQLVPSKLQSIQGPPKPDTTLDKSSLTGPITQDYFYRFINPLFRDGDIVLTETGTASHGGRALVLPPGTRFFSAITWLSIGYMLPATLGAALAQRDTAQGKRTVLFMGDGSLQMTVQELSTIIKEKLDVIIILINNDGYTIERVIHGRTQGYNDIFPWNHRAAMTLFGAGEQHASENYLAARTWEDLTTVLQSPKVQEGSGLRIVEVFMDRLDCQGALKDLLQRQVASEKTEEPPLIASEVSKKV